MSSALGNTPESIFVDHLILELWAKVATILDFGILQVLEKAVNEV